MPDAALDLRVEIDVTSGVLEIGDADAVDELAVVPGTYSTALRATPAEHPTHIELWLERRGLAGPRDRSLS